MAKLPAVRFLLPLLLPLALLAAVPARPDLVVFLTDDQSQGDVSPYGGGGIRTPNLQALADGGLTFTRAYVASPSCAPSRAALLTGRMPARNGAEANHSRPQPGLRKWPAYFQELGYEVVAFGKVSHYRQAGEYGFDAHGHDVLHGHAGMQAAIDFLQRRPRAGARPLCLMVGSHWPHVPWPDEAPEYDPARLPLPPGSIDTPRTRAWRARYAAAVTRGDDQLGEILAAVRTYLAPDVLVLFTADHGAQWPLGKWNLYEAGVCVPLVVSWPGRIRPGGRTDAMVSWVDLLPTLLEAAGGRPPADLDGRSFLAVLTGAAASHRDRIFTTHSNDGRMNVYPARAVRDQQWKYIRNLRPELAFTTHIDLVGGRLGQRDFFATWEAAAGRDPAAAAVLERYHRRPAEELYNLAVDPAEQVNLAADPRYGARLAALRGELDAWMKEQGDRQTITVEGRPLADRKSYGPGGAAAEEAAKRKKGK
ncbi:MAG: sulfatase [Verrucomicrobia bacterium]|nr:sulfatase [Verrucomicrobiota bacterium]